MTVWTEADPYLPPEDARIKQYSQDIAAFTLTKLQQSRAACAALQAPDFELFSRRRVDELTPTNSALARNIKRSQPMIVNT